ncbi:MAG: efflux RND transporter permease subunit, partial [Pseudomonadales bacterium]
GGASHTGRIRFETLSPDKRNDNVSMNELVRKWRQKIGDVPGAQSVSYRAEIGRGASNTVDVQISGNNLAQMQRAAGEIRQWLGNYPGTFDITDNLSDGKEEIQIELKPQASLLGLSRSEIIRQVRQAIVGIEVQRFQRARDDVVVSLRLPLEERNAFSELLQIEINTADKRKVALGTVVELSVLESPSAVYRIDFERIANVGADIDKKQVNATVLNRDLATYLDELEVRYAELDFSLEGEAKEQRESFGSLQWGLVFVFFAIYALLAIPFKSYAQPLIVMSVIPYGAIGAIGGHALMGMDLTMMSLLGLLALIGVVVNDSLVLVSFVNQQRARGESLREAVLKAGGVRFRPVMLTSITTFAGLMPLLFEQSTQAQFLIPMAVSLGFGIIFATLITLLLIPINYLILEDLRKLLQRSNKTVETAK